MKDLPPLLSAISSLLWPLFAIVVVVVLLPEIRQILKRVRSAQSFNLKWGDKEITVQEGFDNLKKVVRDIVSEMEKESATGTKAALSVPLVSNRSEETSSRMEEAVREGNRILWVDDKPQNNLFESQQLRSSGWEIHPVLSTLEALSVYSSAKFAFVITDMQRREDGKVNFDAGIDLLLALKEMDPTVRVICYCGSGVRDSLRVQFLNAGGKLITSSSLELVRAIGTPTD